MNLHESVRRWVGRATGTAYAASRARIAWASHKRIGETVMDPTGRTGVIVNVIARSSAKMGMKKKGHTYKHPLEGVVKWSDGKTTAMSLAALKTEATDGTL